MTCRNRRSTHHGSAASARGRAAISGAILGLCAALAGGCYRHHDAGDPPRPRPDAGGRLDAGRFLDTGIGRRDAGPDAGPPVRRDSGWRDGDFWTLEARAAELSIPHRCRQVEGGRVAVRVSVSLESSCEFLGPVQVQPGDATEFLTAHVWVRHRSDPASCVPTRRVEERTVLFEAYESGLRARSTEGDSTAAVSVDAIDGRVCRVNGVDGEGCLQDCDCADGRVCIPDVGPSAECVGGRCGYPCDSAETASAPYYADHLDCLPEQQCRFAPDAAAPSCHSIPAAGCTDDCGPGLTCPPTGVARECVWDLRLTAMNRHLCMSDADCDHGLVCVHHASESPSCEVPCFERDMRCPVMHHCSPARWVCEWDGE